MSVKRTNFELAPSPRPGGAFIRREDLDAIWRVLHNVMVGNQRGICNRDNLRIPAPATNGSGMVEARITGGSGTSHTADLYANGSEAPATTSGAAVTTPNVATGKALPVGTLVWVARVGTTYKALGTVWQ